MSIDVRDAALQALCPTIMVPLFGAFQPLQESGHRFLAADNGLWVEAYRPWIYICQPLALQNKVAMPYGSLTPTVTLAFGSIPSTLLDEFAELAREHLPNECAACVVWSEDIGFELRPLGSIKAHPEKVKYQRPVLAEHEHLVLDLHSHASFTAGFSKRDNRDDRDETKIAAVVGNLDRAEHSLAIRLCVQGLYIDLNAPAQ